MSGRAAPEIREEHRRMVNTMRRKALTGWYLGDMPSLAAFAAVRDIEGVTEPELKIRLMLTRDKMHHSVGWWRNAEYEYCWHLSISAWDKANKLTIGPDLGLSKTNDPEDVPADEERYWTFAFFPEDYDKVWHEPGGTDPRLTPGEKMRHRHFSHIRLFLDPETFVPFIPQGEVYDLTRWIDGLTPEKVDR